MVAGVLGAMLIALAACNGAVDGDLARVTKSARVDWQLVGYGLERCSPTASCDDASSGPFEPRLMAIYVDKAGSLQWTARVVSDSLPSAAINDTFDLGGLAADPNNSDKLYLMAVFGGAPEYLWSFDLTSESWSEEDTFSEPGGNIHYYGLGEQCDGDLTSVMRESSATPSSSTDPARLVSFPPSDPESFSTVFLIEQGLPFGDNATSYSSQTTKAAGTIFTTSEHFLTDGTNYTFFSAITEPWVVGVMANPITVEDSVRELSYGCERDFYLATNDGTTTNGPSVLYLVNSGNGEAATLAYTDAFEVDHPALRDLANLPGWCNASLECGQ